MITFTRDQFSKLEELIQQARNETKEAIRIIEQLRRKPEPPKIIPSRYNPDLDDVFGV